MLFQTVFKQIVIHSKSDQITAWLEYGGIFCAVHHMSKNNHVKNLIVLGSPIDSFASGGIGKLYKKVNHVLEKNRALQHKIYSGSIPKRLLHTPGFLNAFGFKILDPKGWYEGHKQLLLNLDDQKLLHETCNLRLL